MKQKNSKSEFYAVDLFAGCGGLSEGFTQAGFKVIAQIEMDDNACETLRTRHLYYELKKRHKRDLYNQFLKGEISGDYITGLFPKIEKSIKRSVIQAEFGKIRLKKLFATIDRARKYHNADRFHLVMGGPPCQPYSLVGRSRDPDRMELDSRHYLYEHYLKVLEYIQPDFFVFENVPGLITAEVKSEKVFTRMLDDFRNISPSYEIAPSFDEYSKNPRQYLLDSSNYGVPQRRKRIIFVGYKRSLLDLNSGIKEVFKKLLKPRASRFWGYDVSSAIGDLPSLKQGQGNDGWYGKYPQHEITPYQSKMRYNSLGVMNHKARTHMDSDLQRYKFFIEHHKNGHGAATLSDLIRERPDLTPSHQNLDEFIDRFKVQWWNRPASTITAHIHKDGHYYIHPDINQCRSFSVREAARCQSFPDNFKFEGKRTQQFKQVGNAVPPMLAFAIAKVILVQLKKIYPERK